MNKLIGDKSKELRKIHGKRMNYTSETLTNIKTIKFYNWSEVFTNLIKKTRQQEFSLQKYKRFWDTLNGFIQGFFPHLIQPITISIFVAYGNSMSLSLSTRISSLLGNFHGLIIHRLPHLSREYHDIHEALEKLEEFYALPEIAHSKMVGTDPSSTSAIKISNKSFTWGIKIKKPKKDDEEKDGFWEKWI